MVRNLPANARYAGDIGSVLRLGRSPGVGNGNHFSILALGKSHGQKAWQASAHRVAESDMTEHSTASTSGTKAFVIK